MEIADTIKFRDICSMLNKIKEYENKDKKAKIVKQYYDSFCKHREKFREQQQWKPEMEEDGRSSFYCVLRCLIPNADMARPPYGLQIPSLGKVFIKILQLGSESRDAEILEARNFNGFRGDYAERVYRVLKPRCSHQPSNLTLKQVHDMLDTIANENRLNTEKVLIQLSETASAEEQMWFVRLLLKSMHLGIGDQRIFGILHPQAKAFFQICANLSKLCCNIADNKFNLATTAPSTTSALGALDLPVNIQPFEYIRPQLCEVFPGNIENLMANDVLYMETKMDGERFQLHYQNNRFKYFSRKGIDYTHSFGSCYDEDNKLTSKLQHLLPIGMTSVILDGEMMVWNTYHNKYHEKGENTDVKNLNNARNCQPCFVVYDLLFWNGESMLKMPYIQRMHKLKHLFKEQEGVLQLMKSVKVTSPEDFKQKFQQALDQHEEGVVLKQQRAAYAPGRRNGSGWYKVKADYIEGLTTEFDLLVIGAFFNRTRTFVESFLVGVLKYVSLQQFEVYSIGKVSNNTTQRVVLNNTLKPHWHLATEEPPPLWYHYRETNAEGRPDAWIEPRNSVILQIKATDLNPSGAFALSMALHFPRIQAWRNDKLWHECLSLEEYNQLKQSSGRGAIKKIVKRTVSLEDFTGERVKRRKMTAAEKRNLGLQAYNKKFDPSNVEKVSNLLNDFSVCILSASLNRGYTPEYLKTLVVQNGGTVVDNPLPNNPACIVVAGDKTYRVQMLCKAQQYDIVSMDWFLRICEKQKFKLRPRDMLSMTDNLRERFSEFCDKWGDHYTEFVSSKELKRICDHMQDKDVPDLDDEELLELENLIYKQLNRNWFRNKYAYFYTIDAESEKAKLSYQWHGGNVLNDRNLNSESYSKINYVFINLLQFDKTKFLDWLKERFSDNLSHLQIINITWILESHKARMMLDVKEYTWHDF
ncbi:DNA ligase 4 [Lucilia sericata]|uniref:DNA ligase 4 n=1 Tax=Lucilia sericata TaxID=13632 RepID=UPI0018A7EF11|nr:DNA ligase 4 [Lucilia sericata]